MSHSDLPAILPVFLPHRGCPGRCIFCDQRIQSGESNRRTPSGVATELRSDLEALRDSGRSAALAFYGGSFDGLPDGERAAWLGLAGELAAAGLIPGGLRVSAHPAGLTEERVAELVRGGVGVVEVGVQSLDDAVLRRALRGHDAAEALEACRRVMDAGIRCVAQLMVGLPGADAASDLATAEQVAELRPDGVRIHPTLALQGTGLEALVLSGEWRPPELDEAVARSAGAVEVLERAGVPVLRVGIQEVEGLREQVVAGAWHPAFGELVRGEVLARRIARDVAPKDGVIHVQMPRSSASLLLGHGRRGLKRVEELTGCRAKIVFDDASDRRRRDNGRLEL